MSEDTKMKTSIKVGMHLILLGFLVIVLEVLYLSFMSKSDFAGGIGGIIIVVGFIWSIIALIIERIQDNKKEKHDLHNN